MKTVRLTIQHQGNLHVWIRQTADIHLLEVFRLKNNNRQFSRRWHVSQTKADVAQLPKSVVVMQQRLGQKHG